MEKSKKTIYEKVKIAFKKLFSNQQAMDYQSFKYLKLCYVLINKNRKNKY